MEHFLQTLIRKRLLLPRVVKVQKRLGIIKLRWALHFQNL